MAATWAQKSFCRAISSGEIRVVACFKAAPPLGNSVSEYCIISAEKTQGRGGRFCARPARYGWNDQTSNLAPISLANSRQMAVLPGQAGEVTRLRSTTAWSTGTSTYSPPATVISGPTAG